MTLFRGTSIYHSVKGRIDLIRGNGIKPETVMFNDWVEIGVIIRELCMKHGLVINITMGTGNKRRDMGIKCVRRGKVRMVL